MDGCRWPISLIAPFETPVNLEVFMGLVALFAYALFLWIQLRREPPAPAGDPLSPGEAWALAAAGHLAQVNGDNFSGLVSNEAPAQCRSLLQRGWSVYERGEALRTLDWLLEQGHQAELHEQLHLLALCSAPTMEAPGEAPGFRPAIREFLLTHDAALRRAGIVAWDAGRLIQVARWCHGAGYISRDEAWERIFRAARRIQLTHTSWEEYARHYSLGHQFWQILIEPEVFEPWDEEDARAVETLLHDPASPWRTVAWNTPLDASSRAAGR